MGLNYFWFLLLRYVEVMFRSRLVIWNILFEVLSLFKVCYNLKKLYVLLPSVSFITLVPNIFLEVLQIPLQIDWSKTFRF